MAIEYDNSSSAETASSSSFSFAHSCSGSDRILFVYVYWGSSRALSGVTYNGVGMTNIVTSSLASNERMALLYLVAPSTGSNNVVITLDGASSIEAFAVSYTGAAQTSPIDAYRTETDVETGTTIAESLTTTTNDCFIIWATREYLIKTVTAGTNTSLYQRRTERYGCLIAGSSSGQGTAGSKTLNLSANASGGWAYDIIASFKPATGGGVSTFIPKIIMI